MSIVSVMIVVPTVVVAIVVGVVHRSVVVDTSNVIIVCVVVTIISVVAVVVSVISVVSVYVVVVVESIAVVVGVGNVLTFVDKALDRIKILFNCRNFCLSPNFVVDSFGCQDFWWDVGIPSWDLLAVQLRILSTKAVNTTK